MSISQSNKRLLFRSFFWGGLFSIICIFIGIALSLVAWETFFTYFHKFLGFKGNSWMFKSSDTLIRLFPIKYWLDMFMTVFSAVLLKSIFLVFIAWLYEKKR